jgi:hypothetical protein
MNIKEEYLTRRIKGAYRWRLKWIDGGPEDTEP